MKPRVFTWLIPGLLLVFCLSLITGPGLASADFGSTEILSAKSLISPNVQSEIQASTPEAMLTVLVTMREQANLNQIIAISRTDRLEQVIDTLKSKANRSQVSIQRLLSQRQSQGLVSQVISFWIFNGLSVTATPSVIQELAGRQDVAQISSDSISILPVTGIPEPNIAAINAPALWTMGYFGQNVIVANLDTGVSMDNPELATRWRGGSNSWYDPYGQHPNSPIDFSGHGSWTMGVMVAGDASGTSIGVAPQAQWIAARIFDDQGKSTTTAIHQALQWILDPDHNPATADAPQVLNNSWTMSNPGCDLTFQLDLQSLRAAGILPVFAAGNFGPNTSTSASPANYPEALAVGAVDNLDAIYAYSSRGPSACSELSTTYPDLVAPGVNIKSTDLYGLYTTNTGTSLAAPHVAGGLALLLSAYPNLPVDVQQSALINSAIDLGNPGQDNTFGAGRLDLLAAYQWISSHSTPTSTPTQTVTSSPTSTPSQTPTVTLTPTVTMTATPTQTATFTSTSTVQPTPTVTQTPTGTATATVLQYHTLLPLLLNKQTP